MIHRKEDNATSMEVPPMGHPGSNLLPIAQTKREREGRKKGGREGGKEEGREGEIKTISLSIYIKAKNYRKENINSK